MADFSRAQELLDSDPEQFRKLLLELRKTQFVPHVNQKPILDSTARFKVVNCGRRFGKSLLAAHLAVKKAREPNQMIWWCAPTYRVAKRGYAMLIAQIPEGVLLHEPVPETAFDSGRSVALRFKNGSKIELFSAERPEGMLGAAVDLAILDEAAIMPGRIWNQIISPTLIDREGSALMISTPRGRNWFYSVWLKGQDESQTEWASWSYSTQENPTLPPGEADRLAADLPRLEADQEIYAKWLAAGSSVFLLEEFAIQRDPVSANGIVGGLDEDGNPYGPEITGTVFLGVDLARTSDYTVLYGEIERNRRNCFYARWNGVSWPEQKLRIKRAVRTILRAGADHVTLMVDDGGGGSVIIEDLQEEGYDVVGVNFTTSKANMVRLLATDLEMGRAFVLEDGLTEFENYGMKATASGKTSYSAPEGQHDDIVSSKILAHHGAVNEGFGEVEPMEVIQVNPTRQELEEEDEDDFSDLLEDEGPMDLDDHFGQDIDPGELLRRGWF